MNSGILPHRHDFEKCLATVSADLTQIGWGNPHPYLLGKQFDQHHDAALAIGHLVDTFDTGKRCFGQAYALTGFEQALGLGLDRCLLRAQGVNQTVCHLGRLYPKADQPANAFGRTDG